jgi:hypothetical protein
MRSLRWFGLLGFLLSNGCILKNTQTRPVENPPQKMFSNAPTEADLVSLLNKTDAPNQKITAFAADTVWIDAQAQGQKAPTVRGDLICEKPRNFRLRGRVAAILQLDLGSNNERFWFWVKESPEPHIFHCSYEDFDKGTTLPFPFQPEWVVQVLGMGEYGDPANFKVTEKGQTYELSEESTLQGKPVKKVVVFAKDRMVVPHPQILEHRVVDAQGKVICFAKIDRVARDSKTKIIYPDRVTMEWPAEQLKMTLGLNSVTINQPSSPSDVARFYSLPDWSGTKQVDLGRLNSRFSPSSRIQPVGSYSKSRN